MAPEDDFKNLDEKKLKYELFRALRSHESQRVITILEFEKESVNWKHGYGGHSVLLQTLFENDPIVFNYLLTRDDLDLNAKDDNGHDIFYWMQFSGSNAAIDYKSRLIEVRGSIGQKLHHAAESKIKSNFVESEAMRRQDPQQAPLSLNIGTRGIGRTDLFSPSFSYVTPDI